MIDGELNELVTLAGTTADRPATYTIPSSADLDTARNDVNDFIPWLKEGGDHGKVMWLATCGSTYPDVAVRIMDIVPVDDNNLTLKVFRPLATDQDGMQKEMEAATDPNMEVHIVGQPEAKRLQKDDVVRFTGTLSGYTQNPFLLTWDAAKVNADDIPPEKPAPGTSRPAAQTGSEATRNKVSRSSKQERKRLRPCRSRFSFAHYVRELEARVRA